MEILENIEIKMSYLACLWTILAESNTNALRLLSSGKIRVKTKVFIQKYLTKSRCYKQIIQQAKTLSI